jgi:hypothetical protein
MKKISNMHRYSLPLLLSASLVIIIWMNVFLVHLLIYVLFLPHMALQGPSRDRILCVYHLWLLSLFTGFYGVIVKVLMQQRNGVMSVLLFAPTTPSAASPMRYARVCTNHTHRPHPLCGAWFIEIGASHRIFSRPKWQTPFA